MVNDSTRGYSVYVSGTNNAVQGSGVLFYAGGNTMFVFTCAHVVDDLNRVKVVILKEIDAKRDLYQEFAIEVPDSQIFFSPLDIVMVDEGGNKTHSEDIAIIQLYRPAELDFPATNFFITETCRNRSVYVQGYPNGVPIGEKAIEYLDYLHGVVVVNPADSNRFTIRMDDTAIDSTSRVNEIKGMSGAPVWEDDQEVNGLLGLLTSAYDSTALLSKVRATKAQRIRAIMKEQFHIVIERKLEGIPEADVAGNDFAPIALDGTTLEKEKTDNENWIAHELTALHVIIEDLKLQKAIDQGREVIADPRYEMLTRDSRLKVKQYLLYCYEIADLDDEFEALEIDMRERGLIKEHDTLRQLTRSFMKRNYNETIEAAQSCIVRWEGESRKSLLSIAKAFLLFSKAYVEGLPVEKTIGVLLDEKENFTLPMDEAEDAALIYQMIGYVYGERYHDYVNSVRFLNRSYRIGYENIILESLGAAYYNLGVFDATDKNGIVSDARKVDRKALYKARECFLSVIEKADELFWAGTMRRIGMCIYNTFFFLQDNYRILTVYPDVKRYVVPAKEVDASNFWRDVEMKHARIVVQSGTINTNEYPHIRYTDRILLDTLAEMSKCGGILEGAMAESALDQMRQTELERYLKSVINEIENRVRIVDKIYRKQIYVQLMNLYGRGMHLFGWKKLDKLKSCVERIEDDSDPELLETLYNFIFEFEAPLEEVIQRFKETFEKRKNLESWQELSRLYIRHGMMDQADRMYRELVTERKELIAEGPEYAYRAFIHYVMMHKRDLRYALQCFIEAKEAFKDTDIEGFWELELMIHSNMFNDPERFEVESKPFLEKGLISEEQYHRTAFIAYLANLDEEKAKEHNEYVRQYPHLVNPQTGMTILDLSEIHFLNWIGEIQPGFAPPHESMTHERAEEVRKIYHAERWHRKMDYQLKNQIRTEKTIAIDAWALYQLMDTDMIGILDELDHVYVSHMSIIRLHEEFSNTNNQKIHKLQEILKKNQKVQIWSGGFRSQLEVRNVARYFEAASAVAIGIEKDCIVVLGEPLVEERLKNHFGSRIVRVNELRSLLSESIKS